MSVNAWSCHRDKGAGGGFVLVEVMVAIVLIGSVMGGLVHGIQMARDAAQEVRDKAAVLSRGGADDPGLTAWQWGAAQVDDALWEPGPELVLMAGKGATSVGVWVEGWFLGEWAVDAGELLRLGPAVWGFWSGAGVVIRAREEGGAWGPPWRSLLPEEAGGTLAVGSETCSLEGVELGFGGASLAAHRRVACHAEISSSWAEQTVVVEVSGSLLLLPPAPAGTCVVACGGRWQSWVAEEGGELDVYF